MKKNSRRNIEKFSLIFIILFLILIPAFIFSSENPDNSIFIGLSYPFYMDNDIEFKLGFQLALDQINATGGINGRELKVLKVDDKSNVAEGMKAAQYFVEQEVVAVIGHFNSSVALITAQIYDNNNTVYIAPCATTPFLMKDSYTKVFRTIPDDKQVIQNLFDFISNQGIQHVAVYYAEDDFGRGVADSAQSVASDYGIEIIDRTTIVHQNNFHRVMDRWRALDCEAVLIGATFDRVKDQIKAIKQAIPDILILGTSSLDYPDYIPYLGKSAEGSIIPTHYKSLATSQANQDFIYTFKQQFRKEPDMYAAIAYDTLMILKTALERATRQNENEKMGITLSETLLDIRRYSGVTGTVYFNKNGEIEGDNIFLKIVVNGEFIFLDDD
ncbi:MAG TPA: ABC transporter substrate-binding protein [Thermotogota bacterium]|nr:ABC transporter substrate-binding protein [Thermotogota bacterium]HRW34754.1 ABC transporter substrate-binding protein [Thermotogota bacterium]